MKTPVFNRYFRVEGGKLGELLLAQLNAKTEYIQKLDGIARSLKATQVHTWATTGDFAGFSFPEEAVLDPNQWVKNKQGYWMPIRKKNRAFYKIIRDMGIPGSAQDALRAFGLDPVAWMQIRKERYGCKVTGFYNDNVWWVEVPSRHFDAATLELAARAKAEGASGTDPINMLWQPPADWVEVTVGQYLAEWDELRQKELKHHEQ